MGQARGFVGKGSETSTCPSEDYCESNGSGDQSGVCQARLAPGEACVDAGSSSENRCIDGALCRVGHCFAIMVVKEGQSCDGDIVVCEEGMRCDQGFECDTPFTCREGVCRNASFCSTPPGP